MTSVLVLLAVALAGAGYVLGARRGRNREQALRATLDEHTGKLALVAQDLTPRADIDPVTGLHTQQHFQEFLEREWRRASRERQFLSVIMMEVDYFRAYNERQGKAQGDVCLRSVADTVKPLVHRRGDLVARYGGPGRFGIVLGGTESEDAVRLAQRLRTAIESLNQPNPASAAAPVVTVSVGVAAAMPDREGTWQDIQLIASAERALAQAREAGRNTVVLDTQILPVRSANIT